MPPSIVAIPQLVAFIAPRPSPHKDPGHSNWRQREQASCHRSTRCKEQSHKCRRWCHGVSQTVSTTYPNLRHYRLVAEWC